MASIKIINLGKAYRQYPTRWSRLWEWLDPRSNPRHVKRWILQGINLSVAPGEAVGIIGVNGAGKSTLLKLITGTTQPTTGRVEIKGRVAALLELGMGFHPDFTGRQNVYMGSQLLGYSQEEVDSMMTEIEAFAEIGEYFDQPVRVYSSGMQVRLAFSVATASRPEVLIIDEALAVGDISYQQKCVVRIQKYLSQGTTLLFVSHDPSALRVLCDRLVWLDSGSIKMIGAPKEILDGYNKSLYSRQQDTIMSQTVDVARKPDMQRDCRQDIINQSGLNNQIKVYKFERDAFGWGTGDAKIKKVEIHSNHGKILHSITGGEEISLMVEVSAVKLLSNVFVGFMVRDRLGQNLFGDNSYLSTVNSPVKLDRSETLVVSFRFFMPPLPSGRYTVTAAVASGNQKEHTAHEWIDDAFSFDSINGENVNGLVGLLMQDILVTTMYN